MVQGVDVGPVPSRRRTEEARQARGQARRDRRARERRRSTRRWRRSARRPTARNGSRPGRTRRIPGSTSPRATASIPTTNTGSNISTSRSATSGTTSAGSRRAKIIDRPTAKIASRARPHHRRICRIARRRGARRPSSGKLGLARTVFPYVENHNFYIEHWSMSVFWRKMRDLSKLLHEPGFWTRARRHVLSSRQEVRDALFDYGNGWAVGAAPIGPHYWPAEIERRARSSPRSRRSRRSPRSTRRRRSSPSRSRSCSGASRPKASKALAQRRRPMRRRCSGMAASPGVVEGLARVIRSADDLGQIEEGEILVTPVTAPSWAPVFGKIRATVTDIGGMMSHAAIVCREYGLPAVTGTGSASSSQIKNGPAVARRRRDGRSHHPVLTGGIPTGAAVGGPFFSWRWHA